MKILARCLTGITVFFFLSAAGVMADPVKKMMTPIKPSDVNKIVGKNDSVIVVSGKIDMGQEDYFSVQPAYIMIDDLSAGYTNDYYVEPQFKNTEASGYKVYLIYKNTATDPAMWKHFTKAQSPVKMTIQPFVKIGKKVGNEIIYFDGIITSPSPMVTNYNIGPVIPK